MLKKLWNNLFGKKLEVTINPKPYSIDVTPSPGWLKHMAEFQVEMEGKERFVPLMNEFMNDFLTPEFVLTDGIDPWDPNLTEEQKEAIFKRARIDPEFYFTKIVKANPNYRPDFRHPKTTDVPQYVLDRIVASKEQPK